MLEQKSTVVRGLKEMPMSRGLCATMPGPFGMSMAWNRSGCELTASTDQWKPAENEHPIIIVGLALYPNTVILFVGVRLDRVNLHFRENVFRQIVQVLDLVGL